MKKKRIFLLTLIAVFFVSYEALADSRMKQLTSDISDRQAVKSTQRETRQFRNDVRDNVRDLNVERRDLTRDKTEHWQNEIKFSNEKFQRKIDRVKANRSLSDEQKEQRIKKLEEKRAAAEKRFSSKHTEFRNNLRGDDRILPSGM